MLIGLAEATYNAGQRDEARARLREALEVTRRLDYLRGYVWVLQKAAHIAVLGGEAERAAILGGADEVLREQRQIPLWPEEKEPMENVRALINAALDDATYAAAWARGRATPIEAALDLVMRML